MTGHLLKLPVRQGQPQLLRTVLDRVPARQPVGDTDVPGHAKVVRVQNFISLRVVQHSLGMDTRFMGESCNAGDVVVKRHVDTNSPRDEEFQVT